MVNTSHKKNLTAAYSELKEYADALANPPLLIVSDMREIRIHTNFTNTDGSEAQWPPADAIVGNPPFLGNTFMIDDLGEDYVTRLRRYFAGRVPGAADLVTYCFERARSELETDRTMYAGLVATNSIRGGANRKILARVRETGVVFEAWSDEPWVLEEPAVRVSLVCFTKKSRATAARPNGVIPQDIYSDLTGHIDVPSAKPLCENENVCFEGIKKYGPFDIDGHTARSWLHVPQTQMVIITHRCYFRGSIPWI